MKTLRTYSLNNFPVYHTAVLTILIMLYVIFLVLIYLMMEVCTFDYLSSNIPSPHSLPLETSHKSHLFFSEFGGDFLVFLDSTYNGEHAVWICLSDLFDLAWCLQDPSTVSQMIGFPYYLWLNYTHTHTHHISLLFYPFIHYLSLRSCYK